MAKQTPACVGSDSGLQFPLYLLPPIPFLRKPKPNSSDAAELKRQQAAAKLKRKKYGKDAGESEVWAEEKVLNGHAQYLKCRKCQSDLCFASNIISKGMPNTTFFPQAPAKDRLPTYFIPYNIF